MMVSDVIVALDWSDEPHGIKLRFADSEILLLSNHEVDSGNDFYPKIKDAAEEKPASAEVRIDTVPDCKVDSMRAEDRRLVITTGDLQ